MKRRTTMQAMELAQQVRQMVTTGSTLGAALAKAGMSDKAYRRGLRLLKKAGGNVETGSMSAASIPPRPTGKYVKRPPKPVDMDNIESIAKRLTKVNRMINDVKTLTEERKRLSTRLLHLLKG